jgi:hypothetical protein
VYPCPRIRYESWRDVEVEVVELHWDHNDDEAEGKDEQLQVTACCVARVAGGESLAQICTVLAETMKDPNYVVVLVGN